MRNDVQCALVTATNVSLSGMRHRTTGWTVDSDTRWSEEEPVYPVVMYVIDRQTSDVTQHYRLMPPPRGGA